MKEKHFVSTARGYGFCLAYGHMLRNETITKAKVDEQLNEALTRSKDVAAEWGEHYSDKIARNEFNTALRTNATQFALKVQG